VNGKCFGNKWKFKFQVTEDIYFGACNASNICVRITNSRIGEKSIEHYLLKNYSSSVKISQIE
jgi:hypothetical protein